MFIVVMLKEVLNSQLSLFLLNVEWCCVVYFHQFSEWSYESLSLFCGVYNCMNKYTIKGLSMVKWMNKERITKIALNFISNQR